MEGVGAFSESEAHAACDGESFDKAPEKPNNCYWDVAVGICYISIGKGFDTKECDGLSTSE